MLTAFSHYNLKGFPDTENEVPSLDSPGLALSLDLVRRSMADLVCGAGLSLPQGLAFADLLQAGAGFLSLGHTFKLSNPDKRNRQGHNTGAGDCKSVFIPGPQKAVFSHQLPNSGEEGRLVSIRTEKGISVARADADDFKYLCRLFGLRFSEVEAFRVRNTMTFIPWGGPEDNVLSYQMAEILVERRYEGDVTSFFELVRNKGGNNFILFWEALPDIFGERRTGEARGCTIMCEALALRRLVSDDSRAAGELPLVLPTVERLGALIGRQYRRGV